MKRKKLPTIKVKKEKALTSIKTKIGAFLIEKELSINTIYKLATIKEIEQMLITMYETTIKEYNLHEPTIKRIQQEKDLKQLINKKLKEVDSKLSISI